MLCLTHPTRKEWIDAALGDLAGLLADHAHCEMKAASNALALAGRAVARPAVMRALVDLAEEELTHFRHVLDELERRGIALGPPTVDYYAAELRRLAAASPSPLRGHDGMLIDRLLVGALIEARSCERFRALSEALTERGQTELGAWYRELMTAEARHFRTFVELATGLAPTQEPLVRQRLEALARAEGELCSRLAGEATIHG